MKIIELSGVVGYDITAQALKNMLPRDGSDVLLKVDSVGGSVYEGNRLYNAIIDYPGKIEVHLGAIAASAASYFPLAAGKENIKVRANTTYMIHKAWAVMLGNSDELKAEAEILDGFDQIMAKAYAKVTGRGKDDVLADMSKDLWIVGGAGVVEAGFASGIVDEVEGEEEEEDGEIIDKSEIQARIEESKILLKKAIEDEDLGKWAAQIKADLNKVDVDETGQALLFEETAPVNRGKNIMEEDMEFNAYLDQNPAAKAECETQKVAYAKTEVESAVKADRERCAKITKLFGSSEKALAAISDGKSVGDMAVEEREAAVAARSEEEAPDLGGLEPKGQMPEKPKEVEASAKVKKQDDVLDKYFGKQEVK